MTIPLIDDLVGIRTVLPEDRSVFLGYHPADWERFYIEFQNGEDLTRVQLSPEALRALVESYTHLPYDPTIARYENPLPPRMVWRQVSDESDKGGDT